MMKKILSTKVIMTLTQKSTLMKTMSILIWIWTLKALRATIMMKNILWKLDQPCGSLIDHDKPSC